MFKDLRTGTKLVLLCAVFLIAIGVTTYSLVREKLIAIEFAQKELGGTKDLAMVRDLYGRVLTTEPFDPAAGHSIESQRDALKKLTTALLASAPSLKSPAEPTHVLETSLETWAADFRSPALAQRVLAAAQQLAARIADRSNLTLDPDLDSYYLQNLIAKRLPALLGDLGQLEIVAREIAASGSPTTEQTVRSQFLTGRLQSTSEEVKNNISAAYRGNPDGKVRGAIDEPVATMFSSLDTYLSAMSPESPARASNTSIYRQAVDSAISAWAASESELNRLLQGRIDGLVGRMRWSLALTGALSALSILLAVMTHWHLVVPLRRLENLASSVKKSKDYGLRINYESKDEIGSLASAFDNMLSELAAAYERERTEQTELARAARLTTMGAMTASIAHEINQPLAAIVANSNAAQRWLSLNPPDVEEVRAALKNIVKDGHRASDVISSVRAVFKKDNREKCPTSVNEMIDDVLGLVRGELRKQHVLVSADLYPNLPDVITDRTQLQQVIMNLIMNGIEAMASITDRGRVLVVRSNVNNSSNVVITIEDSGTGFQSADKDRIFDAFFTTKSEGMGLGLFICRSIVEAHGGRIWAQPGTDHGTVFHITLPSATQ